MKTSIGLKRRRGETSWGKCLTVGVLKEQAKIDEGSGREYLTFRKSKRKEETYSKLKWEWPASKGARCPGGDDRKNGFG